MNSYYYIEEVIICMHRRLEAEKITSDDSTVAINSLWVE